MEVFLLWVAWSRVAIVFEDVPNEALEHVWGSEHSRLRESLVNAEAYFKMRDKKLKVENELRFFKSDFAKMVLAKEEALSQLACTKRVLTELKAEVDKTSLDDLN